MITMVENLSRRAQMIFNYMKKEGIMSEDDAKDLNLLWRRAGVPANEASMALSELEQKGFVKSVSKYGMKSYYIEETTTIGEGF